MTREDLLMEIQNCDEMLYTTAEANLMLEYQASVKSFVPRNEEEAEACKKLIADFEELSKMILELEDRIELTANNVVEPTKSEIEDLRKLFDKIESKDFDATDMYENLIGEQI